MYSLWKWKIQTILEFDSTVLPHLNLPHPISFLWASPNPSSTPLVSYALWITLTYSLIAVLNAVFHHRCVRENVAIPWNLINSIALKINYVFYSSTSDSLYRSSHWRCAVRKGVLRNFLKLTRKHLCQSLFF